MSERSMETYREALSRITAAAFRRPAAPSFASIPARPDVDADCLLADALNELERLRRERDTPIPAEETIAELRTQLSAVTRERDRANELIASSRAIAQAKADGYPAWRRELTAELERTRAQLAAVTAERDAERIAHALEKDAREYAWGREGKRIAERNAARAVCAHQHARRLEEREAHARLARHALRIGKAIAAKSPAMAGLRAACRAALGGGR